MSKSPYTCKPVYNRIYESVAKGRGSRILRAQVNAALSPLSSTHTYLDRVHTIGGMKIQSAPRRTVSTTAVASNRTLAPARPVDLDASQELPLTSWTFPILTSHKTVRTIYNVENHTDSLAGSIQRSAEKLSSCCCRL